MLPYDGITVGQAIKVECFDISTSGIFFYSDFKPTVDAAMQVAFSAPVGGRNASFVLDARAVRVEEAASGTVGVAARLEPGNFLPDQQLQALRKKEPV